jgi:hypothetical protein
MATAFVVTCGGSAVTPFGSDRLCAPGLSTACVGPAGCPGFQVCRSDGSGFDACACGGAGPLNASLAVDGSAGNGVDALSPDGIGVDASLQDAAFITGADSADDVGSVTTDAAAPCTRGGLACSVPAGCTTTLSGTVYDPAGSSPLYHAFVFVPNDPLGQVPAIPVGTHSCGTCDLSIGSYVAATTTDASGHFTLSGVPATTNVPLVVQIGKWRREVFLPSVTACQDNPVPASASRLPRNQTEGDLPQMAITTGINDDLGCFLRSIGIDAKEYTAPHGGGRLDVYQGPGAPKLSGGTAGNCSTASCPLWSSKASLESYDLVLLACEGAENLQTKPAAAMQAMHDWLAEGGKVFATHFHYVWFRDSPAADFQKVATWLGPSAGAATGTYDLDTSFPKGQVLHDWLNGAGVLSGNTVSLTGVANSVSTVSAPTTRWVYDGVTANVKVLSFETPIGGLSTTPADAGTGPSYCGKAVFSDLHAGGSPAGDIPAACTGAALTPQEKALEYLFFDLSGCVAPDNLPAPGPPPSTP